jgi:dual specificity tyrosine-phosphorylation-regulated kinase 2/3/4
VINEIDKGAFGQVVKCFDHKELREVAVKMNRNTSFDHSNSKTEINILRKIREGVPDD